MQIAIDRALDRRDVRPGNRLRFAGRAGGKQDVGRLVRIGQLGIELFIADSRNSLPTQIAGPQRDRPLAAAITMVGGPLASTTLAVQRQIVCRLAGSRPA